MIDTKHLLTDVEMACFLVNGYHMVEPVLPAGLNERVAEQLDSLTANPGDDITETVPELWRVLEHPSVRGALISLLGEDYTVNSHRHWHCKLPDSGYMQWHQDSTNNRNTQIDRLLGLYYPHTITAGDGSHRHRSGHAVSQCADGQDVHLHKYTRAGVFNRACWYGGIYAL